MLKKVLLFLLSGLIIFGIYEASEYYKFKKETDRRDAYYQDLVDTSSPTVTVLKDSITIGYQNEKRTIYVYVPPNYATDTTARFPVMYVMDGESCFSDIHNMGPEWQMDEVINEAHAQGKQTAIVIGIHDAENRDTEYTPFVNEYNPEAHGDKFATWVATELKAWVDTNYRTQPEVEATTIAGISRSGMMAYYMMMAHPDVFGVACVQSPSMWVDFTRLMAMELTDAQLKDKKVYVCVGEKEGGDMVPHAWAVYEKFKAKGLDPAHLKLDIIEGEGHWHLTWRKSFAKFYPWWAAD